MNSDGLPNKPKKRENWAGQYRQNAEARLKRTSIQRSQPGFQYAPYGFRNTPKGILVPNTQAFTDRFAITKQISRYVVTGGAINVDGFDLHAFVYTPSTRLRCRINVYFEADGQVAADPVFLVVPNWRIMNMARNPFSGRESTLQQLYPLAAAGTTDFNANVKGGAGTTPLPDSFTLDNAGELVRCDIHLQNGQFNVLTFAPAGVNCFLTATWEPNVPITPQELDSFYRDCKVVYGIVPNIQKGVVP
jgi:hypothetical protein